MCKVIEDKTFGVHFTIILSETIYSARTSLAFLREGRVPHCSNLYNALNDCAQIDMVYVDYTNTFDKVSHEKLFTKAVNLEHITEAYKFDSLLSGD